MLKNVEEETEQADDKQSKQTTGTETKPGTSLATKNETKDKDETV